MILLAFLLLTFVAVLKGQVCSQSGSYSSFPASFDGPISESYGGISKQKDCAKICACTASCTAANWYRDKQKCEPFYYDTELYGNPEDTLKGKLKEKKYNKRQARSLFTRSSKTKRVRFIYKIEKQRVVASDSLCNCGLPMDGINIGGTDIAEKSVATFEECCSFAMTVSGAKGFTIWRGICYLKGSTAPLGRGNDVVSGILSCGDVQSSPSGCSCGAPLVGITVRTGDDLDSLELKGSSQDEQLEECCKLCYKNPECGAVTIWKNTCYLKLDGTNKGYGDDVVSAILECPSDATTAANSDTTTAATSDVTTAGTSDATTAATSDATTVATSDATTVATSDATTVATSDATTVATSDATTAATSDATTVATSDATTAATSDATTAATSDSTTVATSDATTTAADTTTAATSDATTTAADTTTVATTDATTTAADTTTAAAEN